MAIYIYIHSLNHADNAAIYIHSLNHADNAVHTPSGYKGPVQGNLPNGCQSVRSCNTAVPGILSMNCQVPPLYRINDVNGFTDPCVRPHPRFPVLPCNMCSCRPPLSSSSVLCSGSNIRNLSLAVVPNKRISPSNAEVLRSHPASAAPKPLLACNCLSTRNLYDKLRQLVRLALISHVAWGV